MRRTRPRTAVVRDIEVFNVKTIGECLVLRLWGNERRATLVIRIEGVILRDLPYPLLPNLGVSNAFAYTADLIVSP